MRISSRHDIFGWTQTNATIEGPQFNGKGNLQVRSTRPLALFVAPSETAEAGVSLVGYGTEWDVEISEPVFWFVENPDCTELNHGTYKLYWRKPLPTSIEEQGEEVYTNADRMVMESGAMSEVTQALRLLELERRAMLAEIREERATLDAEMRERALFRASDPATVATETVDEETGEVL